MEDREYKYLKEPWRRTYDLEGVPETFEPYPEMPYTEFFLERPAKKYPNTLAFVQLDYEMTYKELKEKVDRFATALSDMGIKKGDVVATALPCSIQAGIADLAIHKIGAIHLPGSIIDPVDTLVDKFTRGNARIVICIDTNVKDRDVIDKIKMVKERTKLETIILTKYEDFSSKVPEHEKGEGIIWFTDLIKKYPPNPPEVKIDPKKDLAFLIFTGGVTGRPKGVMMSHYGWIANIISTVNSTMAAPSLIPLIEGGLLRIASPLPLLLYGHISFRMGLYAAGTSLFQKDPRDGKEYARLVKKHHPLITLAAPAHYINFLKEEGIENLGLLSESGSAATAAKTKADFEKKASTISLEAYGMTELAGGSHVQTVDIIINQFFGKDEKRSIETAGKILSLLNRILKIPGITPLLRSGIRLIGYDRIGSLANRLIAFASKNLLSSRPDREKELDHPHMVPFVDMKVKIIDENTGETIPMEKVVKEGLKGEMCLDAPWRMLGYWPDVGSGIDEEGYVHSGDIVTVDEWGRFRVVDRTKDMINVSGYKVYSRDIDDLLFGHPGINEAAVIGVPDPERPGSERVKAFIVLKPEYKGKIKEGDIISYLKEKVPPYAVPKVVEFRDELPLTATTKVLKRALREEEIKKMKEKGLLKE